MRANSCLPLTILFNNRPTKTVVVVVVVVVVVAVVVVVIIVNSVFFYLLPNTGKLTFLLPTLSPHPYIDSFCAIKRPTKTLLHFTSPALA